MRENLLASKETEVEGDKEDGEGKDVEGRKIRNEEEKKSRNRGTKVKNGKELGKKDS